MKQETLTVDTLARLLEEAKEAHARYEQETGEYDEQWPRWYAQYILDKLEEEQKGEGVHRSTP